MIRSGARSSLAAGTIGYLPWWVLMSSLVPIVTVSSHSVSSHKIGRTTTATGILRACRRLDQR